MQCLLKITESKIYAILEALSKMDMIEIKKGGKYKVISQSGKDDPGEEIVNSPQLDLRHSPGFQVSCVK